MGRRHGLRRGADARLGAEADRLGLPRPSYEQVRVLVNRNRAIGAARPSTAEMLFDVAVRARPPEAILDHLGGTTPPDSK